MSFSSTLILLCEELKDFTAFCRAVSSLFWPWWAQTLIVPLPLPASAEVPPLPLPPPQAARAARGRTRARLVQAVRRYLLLVELMDVPPCGARVRNAGAFRRGERGLGGLTAAEGSTGRGLLRSARVRWCGGVAQDQTGGYLHVPGWAGVRLLQLPQQQPGGFGTLARDRLGDGGQPDHLGQFMVVEPDHGHVVRRLQAVQAQGAQGTHGHLVGLGEHRRRRAGSGQQF